MATDVSAWLREQREARGWTRSEMARQLIAAGRARGDRQLPGLDGMCHNIYRWERGGPMSERYRLHYCQAFGIQPAQFAPGPMPGPGLSQPCGRTGRGEQARDAGGVRGTARVRRCPGTSRSGPADIRFRRLP